MEPWLMASEVFLDAGCAAPRHPFPRTCWESHGRHDVRASTLEARRI